MLLTTDLTLALHNMPKTWEGLRSLQHTERSKKGLNRRPSCTETAMSYSA